MQGKSRTRSWGVLGALMLVAGLCLVASGAQARQQTLRWKHPDPGAVAGFRVYVGTHSHQYTSTFDVGKPTPDASGVFSSTVSVPDGVTVYVAVAAYSAQGLESPLSNEQSYAAPNATSGGTTSSSGSGTTSSGSGGTSSNSGSGSGGGSSSPSSSGSLGAPGQPQLIY